MEQIPGMNLNQPGMEITPDFLSQMGDMKYIVWVDKTTLDIVKPHGLNREHAVVKP